jgi:hypothetical protein
MGACTHVPLQSGCEPHFAPITHVPLSAEGMKPVDSHGLGVGAPRRILAASVAHLVPFAAILRPR